MRWELSSVTLSAENGTFKPTGINPTWKRGFEFERIRIEDAEVTKMSTFKAKNAEMANNVWFNKLAPHINGVILRIGKVNTGTHMCAKDLKVFKK